MVNQMKSKANALAISIMLLMAGFCVALAVDAALSMLEYHPYLCIVWGVCSLLLFTFSYLRLNTAIEESKDAEHELRQVIAAVKAFREVAKKVEFYNSHGNDHEMEIINDRLAYPMYLTDGCMYSIFNDLKR